MRNIGIVLSGGGALATAHLGLIKRLEEIGEQPKVISGNSAGACVGTLYAHGYTVDEILEIMKKEDWLKVPFHQFREKGILSVEDMFTSFEDYLPKRFERGNLHIGAVDVDTGEVVSYNEGELYTVLKASVALSTFFKPVEYQGKYLVDSALLDNFHIEPLIDICDVIYGSYVIPMTTYDSKENHNVQQLVNRLFAINGYQRAKEKFKFCDTIIDHQYLKNYKILDHHKIDEIFEKSYEYCKQQLLKSAKTPYV